MTAASVSAPSIAHLPSLGDTHTHMTRDRTLPSRSTSLFSCTSLDSSSAKHMTSASVSAAGIAHLPALGHIHTHTTRDRTPLGRSTSLFTWPSKDPSSAKHMTAASVSAPAIAHLPPSGHLRAKKPRKRKSRATPKPPIKELLADKLNFKDMVQELTGQRASSAAPAASCSSSLLACPSQGLNALLASNIMQSLRAAHTISAFFKQEAGAQGAHTKQEKIENTMSVTGLLCNSSAGLAASKTLNSDAVPETYDSSGAPTEDRIGVLAAGLFNQIMSLSRPVVPY